MKKILLILLKVLVILIVAINLLIILSGRFYLYKGIYATYLKGRTGPSIYDLSLFSNATIKKGDTAFLFKKENNVTNLTPDESNFMKRYDTRSFIVIKNDSIIYEQYFNGASDTLRSNSFSAAKTVVGMLIGCAIDEGKIKSVDEPVGNYIPEFKEGKKKIVTIKDLLWMASGLNWTESGKNPFSDNAASYYGTDLYHLVTKQKLITPPGKIFNYQSGDTQLLSFIIKKATGKSVSEYASEKIWSKIGASNDAYWSLDKPGGDEKAFCCIYATTRDFAKIARLILHRGNWNGQQLISKKYFDEFITPAPIGTLEGIPNTRYGYQVWLYLRPGNPVHYCRGILGQYIVAVPKENLIFVRTGTEREDDYQIGETSDMLKIGHPKDVFDYLKIAERIGKLK